MQTCIASSTAPNGEFMTPEVVEDELLIVGDSDEAITLALAPPNKDFSHIVGTSPLTPDIIRTFANWYSSPASEKIARHSYRLHADDVDFAEWTEVEREANEFVAEAFR